MWEFITKCIYFSSDAIIKFALCHIIPCTFVKYLKRVKRPVKFLSARDA